MFQRYHGSPHDYYRYTPNGVKALSEEAGLEAWMVVGSTVEICVEIHRNPQSSTPSLTSNDFKCISGRFGGLEFADLSKAKSKLHCRVVSGCKNICAWGSLIGEWRNLTAKLLQKRSFQIAYAKPGIEPFSREH